MKTVITETHEQNIGEYFKPWRNAVLVPRVNSHDRLGFIAPDSMQKMRASYNRLMAICLCHLWRSSDSGHPGQHVRRIRLTIIRGQLQTPTCETVARTLHGGPDEDGN